MKRKIFLTIVVAILLFAATPGLTLAKQGNSLIAELSREDAFHTDLMGERYNEWHYFSVTDEEQELSIITSFKLSGNIPIAEVLLGYDIGGTSNAAYYVQFTGPNTLDGTNIIINDNKVVLTEQGYEVYANGMSSDGKQIILDAVFKPCTDPSPVLTAELSDSSMNWLVASPKMKVTGTFTIVEANGEEITYKLKNVRGYHDHNWGHWDWANIGWDWGQVTQTKNSLNGNDLGTYTISFGNVILGNTPSSTSSVLNVWKNKKLVEEFKNDEVEIVHNINTPLPTPTTTTISADSEQGNVDIVFTPDYFIPIPIPFPSGTDLIIWEGYGTYEVEGNIDGKDISFEAEGFMEYAPNLP